MSPQSLLSRVMRLARRLTRRRVPAGPSGGLPGGGRDEGGAGVREPRRPRPGPPSAGVSVEPTPDKLLDLGRS